jgi:hypothetical protein
VGERSEPAPGPVVLLTHSRTRVARLSRFLVADRGVVRELKRAEGRLWSDGFVDDPLRLDSGTVSIWRDTAAATAFAYLPGVHQGAVKSQREGGCSQNPGSAVSRSRRRRAAGAGSLNFRNGFPGGKEP